MCCPICQSTKVRENGRCYRHRGNQHATPVVVEEIKVVEVVAPVEPEVVSIMNDMLDELTEEFYDETYESDDEESNKPAKISPSCKVAIVEYESDNEIQYEGDDESDNESDNESDSEEVSIEYSDDTIELDESFYDEDIIDPFAELKRIEKERAELENAAIREELALKLAKEQAEFDKQFKERCIERNNNEREILDKKYKCLASRINRKNKRQEELAILRDTRCAIKRATLKEQHRAAREKRRALREKKRLERIAKCVAAREARYALIDKRKAEHEENMRAYEERRFNHMLMYEDEPFTEDEPYLEHDDFDSILYMEEEPEESYSADSDSESESEDSDSEYEESKGKNGYNPDKQLTSEEIDKLHSYKYYKLLNLINESFFTKYGTEILYAIKNDTDLNANESIHMYFELSLRFSKNDTLDDLFKSSIISIICDTKELRQKFVSSTWFHIKKFLRQEYPKEYDDWLALEKSIEQNNKIINNMPPTKANDSIYLFLSNLKHIGNISSNDLYNLYIEYCDKPISKVAFCKSLNKHGLSTTKRKIDGKAVNVYDISIAKIVSWVVSFVSSP